MRALAFLCLVAALAAGTASWLVARPVRAESVPATVYVSGLHIAGAAAGNAVRFTNTSKLSADFYTLRYLLYYPDGNPAAPAAELALPLLPGRSVSLDVGSIVAAHRAAQEVPPYAGPVQVVVYGFSCADFGTCPPGAAPRPFGPDLIHVEAVQAEGSAVYDAAVQWLNPE